jgi:hypothetical protein
LPSRVPDHLEAGSPRNSAITQATGWQLPLAHLLSAPLLQTQISEEVLEVGSFCANWRCFARQSALRFKQSRIPAKDDKLSARSSQHACLIYDLCSLH